MVTREQEEILGQMEKNVREKEELQRKLNETLMSNPPKKSRKGSLGYVGLYGDGLSYPDDY